MTKKETLRRTLLKRLHRQPARARLEKSARIRRRLSRLPAYRRAKSVLCYVSIDGEVETGILVEQILCDRKKLAVPVVLPGGRMKIAPVRRSRRELMQVDLFGIPVPASGSGRVSLRELDLIIVPGVAFDVQGWRLGRGLGYFDRFLSRLPRTVPRIGLAFELQIVKEVPVHAHDEQMQAVVTEKTNYENSPRR